MRLLILACTGPVDEPIVEVRDGMVHVPGGVVAVGPSRPPGDLGPPPKGGKGPPRGKAPGRPGPGGQPDLGAPLAPGGPAHSVQEPAQWTSMGGQGIEVRDVRVDAFWIAQHEVRRSEYQQFLEATGYRPPHVEEAWAEDGWNWVGTQPPEGTEDHPVVLASWYDAAEYCLWRGLRLPTEAEWQLAALGPKESASTFPWGDEYAGDRLNHGKASEPNFDDSDGFWTTAPVGSFPAGASRYGALDLFGNAWEFTSTFRLDSWDFDPSGPGLYVAVRGGSYFFDSEEHPSGERNHFLSEVRRKTSGFRCAQSE